MTLGFKGLNRRILLDLSGRWMPVGCTEMNTHKKDYYCIVYTNNPLAVLAISVWSQTMYMSY